MITRELTDYIKSMRDLGETTETIRSELISAGWNMGDVNEALAPVAPSAPVVPKAPVTPSYSSAASGAIGSMAKTTPATNANPDISPAPSIWPASAISSGEPIAQKPSSGSVTRFVAEPVVTSRTSAAASVAASPMAGQQLQTEIIPPAEPVKSESVLPDYRQFAEPIIKPATASVVKPATEQSFEQFAAKPPVARFNGQSIPPVDQGIRTMSSMSSAAYAPNPASNVPASSMSAAPAGQFVSSFKGGVVRNETKPAGGGGAVKTIIYILIIIIILGIIGGGLYFASMKFGLFGMQPKQEQIPSAFEPVSMKPVATTSTPGITSGSNIPDPVITEEEDDLPLSQRTTSSTTLSVTGTSTRPSATSTKTTTQTTKTTTTTTVTPAASDLAAADISSIKTSVTKLAEANKAKSETLYKNYLSEDTKKLLADSTINWVIGFEYISAKKSGANAIVTIKVTYEGQSPAPGDFVFVKESGVWKLDIGKTIELESSR